MEPWLSQARSYWARTVPPGHGGHVTPTGFLHNDQFGRQRFERVTDHSRPFGRHLRDMTPQRMAQGGYRLPFRSRYQGCEPAFAHNPDHAGQRPERRLVDVEGAARREAAEHAGMQDAGQPHVPG